MERDTYKQMADAYREMYLDEQGGGRGSFRSTYKNAGNRNSGGGKASMGGKINQRRSPSKQNMLGKRPTINRTAAPVINKTTAPTVNRTTAPTGSPSSSSSGSSRPTPKPTPKPSSASTSSSSSSGSSGSSTPISTSASKAASQSSSYNTPASSGSKPSSPFKSSRLNSALSGIKPMSASKPAASSAAPASKPARSFNAINPRMKSRMESMDETQRSRNIWDAYRSMYETKGYQEGGEVGKDNDKKPSRFPMPIIPGQMINKKTIVNVEVNPEQKKIGEVEKAYYAYPAGFDPTNREDITRKGTTNEGYVAEGDIQYPTGKKQSFTKSKNDPKVAAGRKAAKEMGLKHNEEVEVSDEEFFNFMVEEGLCESMESAEAIFDHMSDDWFNSLYEEAKKKKGRCWTGYKPTPGKEAYSPGSCEKA